HRRQFRNRHHRTGLPRSFPEWNGHCAPDDAARNLRHAGPRNPPATERSGRMNLTWHIVKKDLRALRWPIGVWFLCVVGKLGVGVALLNARGDEGITWFNQMDLLAKTLAVGELLSFVLAAALVQEDLMVGTTAFWMTRPISGGRLLRA